MELLIIIILFVITFNYVFIDVFIKINDNIKLFNILKENNIKEIHCLNNYWFNITRNIFGINIYMFLDKDNNIQTCNVPLENLYNKVICDNYFNKKNHPCNSAFINILKYL